MDCEVINIRRATGSFQHMTNEELISLQTFIMWDRRPIPHRFTVEFHARAAEARKRNRQREAQPP